MLINAQELTIREYWRQVNQLAATLPATLTMVSTPDDRLNPEQRGGVQFVEVEAKTAARLLLARTHRIATPDEVAAQETKREISIRETARRHLAAQGIVAITLPEQGSSE